MPLHYRRKNGSVAVKVEISEPALQRMVSRGGTVDDYTKAKTERVAMFSRREAPVKTGKLRGMIRVQQSRDTRGRFTSGYEVVSNAWYSKYVTDGTPPHVIVPRSPGGVLRFMVGSQVVYTRRVNHPGTKPNNFLERGLRREMGSNR